MKRWVAAILAIVLALGMNFASAEEIQVEGEPAEYALAAEVEAESRESEPAPETEDHTSDEAVPEVEDRTEDAADEQTAVPPEEEPDLRVLKINKSNFPDARFRKLVSTQADTDGDGLLSGREQDMVVVLDASGKKIANLKGVERFTKLEYLYCRRNKLTALDVSRCAALKVLDCGDNKLKKLSLGKARALEYLDCGGNKLTKLDVSGCKALVELRCQDNKLTALNVKKNAALVRLECQNNKLKSVDVRKNEALMALRCQGNPIDKFDIRKLPANLRALAEREDLRDWNSKRHFWAESDDYCLVLPASTKTYSGKQLIYKKGYRPYKDLKRKRVYYKHLSDAQYANFRIVATTGMGKNAMYRGASPLRSSNGRTKQAMKAIKAAGIRTVINMSDDMEDVKKNENYGKSYYATVAVWAKKMTTSFQSQAFRKYIPSICRFMIENEGPYYVHCIWGKDRTGFMCAVLECLMGASGKEVVRDYLVTYYNFYGVKVGSSSSEYITYNKIRNQLAHAFGVGSILDPEVDLSACAEAYLLGCGLSEEEIGQLKARLAADY